MSLMNVVKVDALPTPLAPDTVYLKRINTTQNPNKFVITVTDNDGVPYDNMSTNDVFSNMKVDTVAALRSIPYTLGMKYVTTMGCLTAGDGGGGSWYWDPTATATDNTGTVLKPTGYNGMGRWVRQWAGTVDVRWFGVVADGVTDDTAPLQAALDTVVSGGVLRIPAGTYAASAITHTTLSHVVIEAEGATLKCIAPAVTTQSQNFICLGGSHVTLRGGCIDANRRVNIGLRIERAFNHVTIDGTEVKNVYDNAFTAAAETVIPLDVVQVFIALLTQRVDMILDLT